MMSIPLEKKKLILIFLLSNFFLFLIYYTQIEFTVCDEYQSLLYQLAGGDFSDTPGINFIFQGYIGYSQLYNFLFTIYDKINWVSLFDLLLLIFGFGLYEYRIAKISERLSNNFWWILLSVVSLSIFFLDGFAVISFSRAALMLCGISLFNLLFTEYNNKKSAFYHLVFLSGMLLRPEAGIGMILFISTAFLILKFNIFRLFKRVKYIGLYVMTFIFISWYLINYDDNFLYQIEPEIEYNFMQGNVKPIQERISVQDSIKYEVATHAFIFDPEVLTPDYLRSLQFVPNKKEFFQKLSPSFLKIFDMITFYPLSWVLFFISLMISLLFKKWSLGVKIFMLTILTLFIFTLLNTTSGIGERHMQPFLAMYNLMLLYYFVFFFTKDKLSHPLVWSVSLMLIIWISNIYISKVKEFSSVYVNECKASESRNSTLDNNYQRELIVGTLSSIGDVFYKRYSVLNKNNFNNRYMIFQAYQFSMIPPYDNYIKRVLSKEKYNVKDVYHFFCDQDALYLVNNQDAQLTEDYLNIIYDMDIHFVPEKFQFKDSIKSTIVYRLKCNNNR